MKLSARITAVAFVVAGFISGLNATAENWPRWRGPNDDGVAAPGKYPESLDPKNALWKTPLPGRGCSTPIVWNEKIFLTAPVDGKDAALAFDKEGKILWQAPFGAEHAGRHRNGSGCNSSPATDGKNVFVYFKSGTLAALDMTGKTVWQTNLVQMFGADTLYWDHGTSPVLTEKLVVMSRLHHGESWLAAFDKSTGQMRWKVSRNYETEIENDHSYATPLLLRQGGKESLLVWGAEHLTRHEIADGKLSWSAEGFNPNAGHNWPSVASPVVVGNIAVFPHGRSDRGTPLLYADDLTSKGGTNHLWARSDTGTFVPTPAVWNGNIYLLRDRGELDCLDPRTGKTIWSAAFPKSSANFYTSPLIADGKLYCAREDGSAYVARVSEKFELLSETKLDDRVIASIVPVNGRLLIRSEKSLMCF